MAEQQALADARIRALALARATHRLTLAIGPTLAAKVRAEIPAEYQPREVRYYARMLQVMWGREIGRVAAETYDERLRCQV
jgi:hypothetical protein